ncbi:MAG TPA: hemerythrin domain-containing protein, partial [Pyrinomonadaceae bacterium]|nr:hemerythrin domain-containing protein [Pyrinomonadaceae bacterium]
RTKPRDAGPIFPWHLLCEHLVPDDTFMSARAITEHPKRRYIKTMNAFELLKADHQKVAKLLGKIDETTERGVKTREELFTQVKGELDLHAQIEESIFYPALEEADETRDITLEALEEHRLVKQLLSELASMSKDSEEWTAKFSVLKENVEHHVEEEEGEMFPKAKKVLSKEDQETLGTRMEEAKNKKAQAKKA